MIFGTYPHSIECRCKEECQEKWERKEMENNVHHPAHYQGKGIECIEVIEAFGLGFNLGNAIKYILRAGKKGDRKEDLKKAAWYLNREIQEKHPEK